MKTVTLLYRQVIQKKFDLKAMRQKVGELTGTGVRHKDPDTIL